MDRISKVGCPLPVKIAGLGRYTPSQVIASSQLELKHGLEPGWFTNNLGVTQRCWVKEETPSFMGAAAAREAVSAAGLDLEDIDLIINASTTANFEKLVPDGGPLLQRQLGLADSGIPCFTLQNNFLSFLHALDVCAAFLTTGRYQHILVVTAEVFSFNLDFTNPRVFGLFGDGAAAAVVTLTPQGEASGIIDLCLETFGQGAAAVQSAIGHAMVRGKVSTPADMSMQMDVEYLNKNGSIYAYNLLKKMERNPTMQDIKWVIPPQMGTMFSDSVKELLPGREILQITDRFGFCGAASLPMALYEAVKGEQLRRGDRLLAVGVGAGISVGGMIMTY
ncbi:MAG: 3-oxoacyl-[acyl-carrier-protein] synthase [Acidobacteriota bacterium]|nr:3-oxoacyl-[acyl-carrier-protein] synthase [Acidobacteriota bacterium]